MSTDTALIEKRDELKRRLAVGEYKTLVDIFLEWFDRLLRKIARRTKPFPIWLITVILSLVVILIGSGLTYIAGDMSSLRIVEFYGLGYGLGLLLLILSVVGLIVTAVITNQSIDRIFVLWRDYILDATESIASLQKFEDWLKKACDWRLHLLVSIIVGLSGGLNVASVSSTLLGRSVGFGSTFAIIIANIFTGTSFYLFAILIILSIILRGYDLKLFTVNPGDSELVARLSREFGFFVYFIAAFAAISTLIGASIGGLQDKSMIVVVLFLWTVIIATFILNQSSLSSVIRRAKWKTLNEIQARVEKLHASEKLGEKDTMETINRLMDYYDRIKSTRSSRIDSGAVLNLINSLLLPLLALVLGNIDKILALFK